MATDSCRGAWKLVVAEATIKRLLDKYSSGTSGRNS